MNIEKIGVVGAGMMGSEIALVFALAGSDVIITDAFPEAREKAKAKLDKILARMVEKGERSAEDAEATKGRLTFVDGLEAYGDRDLVIEAVSEDEDLKAEIWGKLDGICPAASIFASNTSSIPISVLASFVSPDRRRRFCGMHFFSPASRMKLVEVIPAFDTEPGIIETVCEVCRMGGKEPVKVKDVAGFAVNRLLMAFFIEANKLIEEGVATPEDIDTACRLGLGHPVGPFKLMDEVSNSLCLSVMDVLHDAYGPRFQPPYILKQMVRAGRHGRRSGRGWYDYGAN